MKTLFNTFALLFLSSFTFGQVTILTNIPQSIAPNSNLNIEVKINKGGISNFSKYQIDVPAGVTVTEGNSKTGNFSFEGNRAKIVWVSIPSEAEFIVSFKLSAGALTGPAVFNQRFFYVDNGTKKEIEIDPINSTFDAAGSSVATNFPESANNSGNNTSTPTSTTAPVAENTVAANNNTVTVTTTSTTPVDTNSLSYKLDAYNKKHSGDKPQETKTTTSTNTSGTTIDTTSLSYKLDAYNKKHGGDKPVETTVAAKKTESKPKKEPATEAPESTPASSSGLVFKIQLGAYGADPGKSKFKALGNVSVNNEGGFYKVVYGKYTSKEEALQKLNDVKAKGFDGFVVKYQNGVRVK